MTEQRVERLARSPYESSPGGSDFDRAFEEPEPRSPLLLWALKQAREALQAEHPLLRVLEAEQKRRETAEQELDEAREALRQILDEEVTSLSHDMEGQDG